KGPARARAFDRTCNWLEKDSGHRLRGLDSAQRIMRFKQQYLVENKVIRPDAED
ncbi:MAG: hypothetical protein GY697_03560, partial [Desulfobacterales bacterium]|nr:hypothetical protein [Desulfobacterales bacterium]